MKDQAIGIVDEPNRGDQPDKLDISRHAMALTHFIQKSDTPITIGIQGEWGSGKTSLLNSIWSKLDESNEYKQIWINSWENSLLCSPEEALLKIISEIIDNMLDSDIDVNRKDKIKKAATGLMKGALRIGVTTALGGKAGEVTEELLGTDENTIKQLRQQLIGLSEEVRERPTNPYQKIVIYVDDLDRIEPRDAVRILELLKNIFNVPGCVFVLAIDYQVVIKGLEGKFGKRTAENEWEFRAFFDKIIQLPFMMPMGQYNIGMYVNDLLQRIGFVDHEIEGNLIENIILRTIGGNPRSVKRLINSLALIGLFENPDQNPSPSEDSAEALTSGDTRKLLLFNLVCLQIAYPEIYNLLVRKTDFRRWDDATAFEVTQRKEEAEKEKFERNLKDAIDSGPDFDEEWEQCLYRICYHNLRYRNRVTDISRLLNFIKDDLLQEFDENLGDVIADVLGETAVTSVNTTDESQITLPERAGKGKRRELENFEMWLVDKKQTNGASDEELKLVNDLHDTIKNEFPNATEKCHKDWSVYLNNHVFFGFFYSGKSFNKKGSGLGLTKHHRTDYRVPNIQGVECGAGKFQREKYSSVRYHQGYSLWIPTFEAYENNKDSIMEAIRASADMMTDENYPKRLKIVYTAEKASFKTFDSNAHDTDDRSRVEELCEEYLSPDYKQS